MNRPRLSLLTAITLVTLLLTACNGTDCVINNTVRATALFYSEEGRPVQVTDTLTVSVCRPQGDSIILNRKRGATEFTFPLSYGGEVDTMVLHFAYGVKDSLFIRHDNTPYFVSLDCGTAMFHRITDVRCSHRLLHSVVISEPQVNYNEQENLQILFRAAD